MDSRNRPTGVISFSEALRACLAPVIRVSQQPGDMPVASAAPAASVSELRPASFVASPTDLGVELTPVKSPTTAGVAAGELVVGSIASPVPVPAGAAGAPPACAEEGKEPDAVGPVVLSPLAALQTTSLKSFVSREHGIVPLLASTSVADAITGMLERHHVAAPIFEVLGFVTPRCGLSHAHMACWCGLAG